MTSRFELRFDGDQYKITVDGVDVSRSVLAADIRVDPLTPPRVVLHLGPTQVWPAEVDLPAKVQIGVPPDPGPAAAQFLEALDPVEVERVALARPDLESVPGGGTAAVMRQLVEWARGRA